VIDLSMAALTSAWSLSITGHAVKASVSSCAAAGVIFCCVFDFALLLTPIPPGV